MNNIIRNILRVAADAQSIRAMIWKTEKTDGGTLLIVDHNGQQWARLITREELKKHYDQKYLFWSSILNLKFAALGMKKTGRDLIDFAGIE